MIDSRFKAKFNSTRNVGLIYEYDGYREENIPYILPVLTYEELKQMPPRYVFQTRERHLSYRRSHEFVKFLTPRNISKDLDVEGCRYYAVQVEVYKQILNELPHYPNKKEAKERRRAKAKQGR